MSASVFVFLEGVFVVAGENPAHSNAHPAARDRGVDHELGTGADRAGTGVRKCRTPRNEKAPATKENW